MISKPEYNLNVPHHAVRLPKELKEISGICYYNNDSLLAIQDEKGIVFMISVKSGEIIQSTPFANEGDYEDICWDSQYIYALRSDAKIFKISKADHPDSLQATIINTPLDKSYDTEGICYDPTSESILIACKESGNGNPADIKNIYRYNLKTGVFDQKPAFSINLSTLRKYLKSVSDKSELVDLYDLIDVKNEIFIYPSGIAIHPQNGDIYVLSSKGTSMMLVLSSTGKLKSIQLISKKLLAQPEGICFTPDADLIISSEGKVKKERLFVFKPIRNR